MLQRLVRLYRTQVELIWRWRAGRTALIKRALVGLVAGVIAFWITAWLLPWLDIVEPGGALIAVAFISILNLLVRPVILAMVASRSVVALVLLTLLFQAFVIWLVGPLVPAVDLDTGLLPALIVSFVYGGIAGAIGLLFGLGEGEHQSRWRSTARPPPPRLLSARADLQGRTTRPHADDRTIVPDGPFRAPRGGPSAFRDLRYAVGWTTGSTRAVGTVATGDSSPAIARNRATASGRSQ